jgi:glycosyltransferase involved in cell wall biosynthesis
MSERKLISIVCPVHNEEAAVPLFYERLQAALAPLRDRYDFELLFTNNGSTDGTLAAIMKLRERDPSVQVLTLSRNFGYEASVATGLRHARGAAIAVIDVDCEDPPELIPEFVREWEAGHDIVYGKRDERQEFIGMHWARKAFYRLNRLIADSEIVLDMAEFFLISAPVRDAILSIHSTKPFLRADVAHVGFQRKGISYQRQRRIAGQTHYNLWRALDFAIGGILSSSTFPLRLSVYLFPVLVAVNIALLVAGRFEWLVAIDFLYLAFFVAMIAIYVARTYKDVVQRPLAVVDWNRSALNKPS